MNLPLLVVAQGFVWGIIAFGPAAYLFTFILLQGLAARALPRRAARTAPVWLGMFLVAAAVVSPVVSAVLFVPLINVVSFSIGGYASFLVFALPVYRNVRHYIQSSPAERFERWCDENP